MDNSDQYEPNGDDPGGIDEALKSPVVPVGPKVREDCGDSREREQHEKRQPVTLWQEVVHAPAGEGNEQDADKRSSLEPEEIDQRDEEGQLAGYGEPSQDASRFSPRRLRRTRRPGKGQWLDRMHVARLNQLPAHIDNKRLWGTRKIRKLLVKRPLPWLLSP